MIGLFCFVLPVMASPFKSKLRLEAENAVLRHQLIVLRRKMRGRVQLANSDRWFFVQMHQSLVKFSESEASNHTPFLADFITTTSGFKFSVHTGMHLCRQTKDRSRAKSRTCRRPRIAPSTVSASGCWFK